MINQILSKIVNEVNEKIPNVNKGGCAVFAYKLAEKLLEYGYNDFKFFIREGYGGYDSSNLFSCTHIWICYDGMEYNRSHWTPTEREGIDFMPIIAKSIKKNLGQWNYDYNRYYNPHITKIINKHFSILNKR